MSDTVKLKGFHGTSTTNADAILKEGFKSSVGDEEWLGDGVYFFTEGISPPPQNNAVKWAIAQSWDNVQKKHTYNNYSVIKSDISVEGDNFLDLTSPKGIEFFNYLRNKYIESVKKGKVKPKNQDFKDGHIINDARAFLDVKIDVTKGNFYIKFSVERIYNINFRTPNATILAVFDVNTINNNLSIIKKGQIQ